MTVGYLKKQLEIYPDDVRIVLDGGPIDMIDNQYIHGAEVIAMYAVERVPNVVLLQTRDDFDYMEELSAKMRYLRSMEDDADWGEKDTFGSGLYRRRNRGGKEKK